MKQLSVALARFPYTNQIDYKIRPAVIISNDGFNKEHNFVWACPITTQASLPNYELEIPQSEFSGQIKTRSFIRTDTIAAMEKDFFLKEIGTISNELFEKLKAELNKNL